MATENDIIFTCFGRHDARAGSEKTLTDAKADGADIRMVYSPLDALRLAKQKPGSRGRLLRDRLRDDGAPRRR
jgi:hydrogenase expression/formation protein HypD